MKDVSKCATITSGGLCVIVHGVVLMLKLLADRLVSLGQVMMFIACNFVKAFEFELNMCVKCDYCPNCCRRCCKI